MNEDTYDKIDRLIAEALIAGLKEDDVSPAMIQAARQYLASRGYTPIGGSTIKKAGITSDPRLSLENLWSELEQN